MQYAWVIPGGTGTLPLAYPRTLWWSYGGCAFLRARHPCTAGGYGMQFGREIRNVGVRLAPE